MNYKYFTTLILVSSLIGCAGASDTPPLGTVTGKVEIDGKPAAKVNVFFSPAEGGRSSSGLTDNSGNYSLTFSSSKMGAIVGQHNVSIAPEAPSPDAPSESGKALTSTGSIPEKYLSEKKQVEVKAGMNTIDIKFP